MSYQYNQYLEKHKSNVEEGFRWLQKNLPEITEGSGAEHNIIFAHDQSKMEPDEYEAYDAYFYGGNRSYAVVEDFRKAWLLHIHRNPHHWQHWVLINDDPEEGEIVLEMPYCYILEMICDWWSFSWSEGNLLEIFSWYEKRKSYIKLHPDTRKCVEDILAKMKTTLEQDLFMLQHHGVKGMKWGVKNGPPYPIDKSKKNDKLVQEAIDSGEVSKQINPEKQKCHTKDGHISGRSYLDGDVEFAQKLVDEYGGKGTPIMDKNGRWTNKEKFDADDIIGTHVDSEGLETRTNKGIITYSKTGSHVYPRKENQ